MADVWLMRVKTREMVRYDSRRIKALNSGGWAKGTPLGEKTNFVYNRFTCVVYGNMQEIRELLRKGEGISEEQGVEIAQRALTYSLPDVQSVPMG